jgi:hypothetical protein
MKKIILLASSVLGLSAVSSQAAIVAFDIQGQGGFGLLSTNETHVVTGSFGSGGEVGAGISYNDVSNELTLNFAWGATNGFTSLTGNATAGHIHGPTANGGVASFTQTAGVFFTLSSGLTWDDSASAGGVTGRVLTLTAPQELELLAGRYYINIHTGTNGAGEIRGNLVAVPESSTALLGALGMLGLLVRKRR